MSRLGFRMLMPCALSVRVLVPVVVLAAAATFGGCSAGGKRVDGTLRTLVDAGEFGLAREHLLERGVERRLGQAEYLLDRARVGTVLLLDGMPEYADEPLSQTYEILRRQGINDGRRGREVLINEDLRYWKGEPFEQAMLYAQIAAQKASLGEWDNARAAAGNSLFLLHDFGVAAGGEPKTVEEVAAERAADDEPVDNGYVTVRTDFALGYLLTGIANDVLLRGAEARDNYQTAVEVRPEVAPVVEAFGAGGWDTVLYVEVGRAPARVLYGDSGELVRYEARWPSDNAPLGVWVDGVPEATLPHVLDLNELSAQARWNNLENVRVAKAALGDALLVGGAAVALSSDDEGAQIAGLGAVLVGLISKLGAHGDPRQLETLPQRAYLVPLRLGDDLRAVRLRVEGRRPVEMVIPGLRGGGESDGPRFVAVRLVEGRGVDPWAKHGGLRYAPTLYEDGGGLVRVPGDDLPYILGGRCVRLPSWDVLRLYQQAGHFAGWTLSDLESLYAEEGIGIDPSPEWDGSGRPPGAHVLEGGSTLVPPDPGTTGFVRLFAGEHPPYRPRSAAVRALAAELNRGGR